MHEYSSKNNPHKTVEFWKQLPREMKPLTSKSISCGAMRKIKQPELPSHSWKLGSNHKFFIDFKLYTDERITGKSDVFEVFLGEPASKKVSN